MALTKDGDGGIYLSISDGKIVRSHKNAVEGVTQSRINKNGKTVHEEKFRDISGVLKAMQVRDTDYGKQWALRIEDGDQVYLLFIGYSSRYATSLLKALPNIDLEKELRLMPWSMIDKNDATKKVTGITVYQDGKKLEPYYTKEQPNGLPQMTQVKLKGQMVWDSTDMDEFLCKMVEDKFKGKKAPF
jgi:hypothetical protein